MIQLVQILIEYVTFLKKWDNSDLFIIIFGFFKNQYTILQQLNDQTYILRWDSNSQPPRLETSRITSTRVIPSWFNSNLLEQHFLIEVGSDAC